jgi:capsid protein
VRRTLRTRARYEVANSPLATGIIETLANMTVGTGPSLRMMTDNPTLNRQVQQDFTQWTIASGLSRKLWLMRVEKAQNGEAFAAMTTNRGIDHPVKLDVVTIEADRVANPTLTGETKRSSDGVIFDDYGNAMAYQVLRQHPGDSYWSSVDVNEVETIRASQMLHYFKVRRSGQTRGVPELTPSLPYFAMRRRYILAVLAAAETAADLAGVIHTTTPVANPAELDPMDAIEIERRMLMTLPEGWDISQMKAEQPTSTIEMFDKVIICEIARCVNMPYGLAAISHAGYNFSSAKADHQPFYKGIGLEQDHLEDVAVDRIFSAFWREASIVFDYPTDGRRIPPHQWYWDGQDYLDPREASANDISLKNGSRTHVGIAAKQGKDIEAEWEAQAKLLGMTIDEYRKSVRESLFKAMAAPAAAPSNDPEGEE